MIDTIFRKYFERGHFTKTTTGSSYSFNPVDFQPSLKTKLLIFQPTPFCNINCSYCYLPDRNSKARISLDIIRQAVVRLKEDDLVDENLTVVWHAGEPLSMPVAFYEEAIAVIHEILSPPTQISHSIQTNATLINNAWCLFFKHHNIRLGVSVDGPARLHDLHRRTRDGKGTHHLVLRGMQLLQNHSINFHAIAVVTDATLALVDDFFDFFLDQGIQELGCNFDEAEGIHIQSSLEGRERAHAAFLHRLLQRSIASGNRVRVRELINAFHLIVNNLPTYQWCGQTSPINAQVMPFALITIAWNGDFSTFSPELLGQSSLEFKNFVLGNVLKNSYFSAARSDHFSNIWGAIAAGSQSCKQSCKYFNYCGGGSPANKLYENNSLSSAETLYCRTMIQRPLEAILRHVENFNNQQGALL